MFPAAAPNATCAQAEALAWNERHAPGSTVRWTRGEETHAARTLGLAFAVGALAVVWVRTDGRVGEQLRPLSELEVVGG